MAFRGWSEAEPVSKRTRHIREFVETLLGPAIYFGFFGLAYLVASLACALSGGNDPLIAEPAFVISGAVLALALVALLLLATIIVDALRRLSGHDRDQQDTFMAMLTVALAALSALAVIWTAFPAATVMPVC